MQDSCHPQDGGVFPAERLPPPTTIPGHPQDGGVLPAGRLQPPTTAGQSGDRAVENQRRGLPGTVQEQLGVGAPGEQAEGTGERAGREGVTVSKITTAADGVCQQARAGEGRGLGSSVGVCYVGRSGYGG